MMDVDIKSEIEESESPGEADFAGQIYDYSMVDIDRLEQSIEGDDSEQLSNIIAGNCCKVCGDSATGMYFGALVCVPCKTFFLRYGGGNCVFECKFEKNCEITSASRTQCKYCRYQKCIQAGMCRKVRPTQVHLNEGQQLCVVCNDVANGVHFGAITCEGCKKFFRRGLTEHDTYVCKNDSKCLVNPRTRNSCRYCRYQKCLSAGMSREAIQMGRPSKVRNITSNGNECLKPKESRCSREGTERGFTSLTDEWLKYYADCALKPDVADKSNSGTTKDSSGLSLESRPPRNGSKSTVKTGLKSGECVNVVSDMTQLSFPSASHEAENTSADDDDDDRCIVVTESLEVTSSASSQQASKLKNSQMNACGFVVPQKENDLTKMSDFTNPTFAPGESPLSVRNQFPVKSALHLTATNNGSFDGLDSSSDKLDNMSCTAGLKRTLSMSSGGHCELNVASSLPFRQRSSSELKVKKLLTKHCAGVNIGRNVPEEASCLHFRTVCKEDRQTGPGHKLSRNGDSLCLNSDFKRKIVSPVDAPSPKPPGSPELRTCIPGKSPPPLREVSLGVDETLHQPFRFRPTPSDAGRDTCHSVTASGHESIPSYSSSVSDVRLISPNSSSGGSLTSFSWTSKNRHQLNNHESPYGTILALASSCQLFSEASRNPLVDDGSCDEVINICKSICSEEQARIVHRYWLEPSLPDENIIFNEKHKGIIKQILSAYERFVQTGTNINVTLRKELDNSPSSDENSTLPEWIQKKVVPVYTFSSITYCKSLPGFQELTAKDQATLIRLGQSQSRLLVAANHWYDPHEKKFHDFLSWRTEDLFKKKLTRYADTIHSLKLDRIESAVLNVLVLIATDYPGLKNPVLIEESRQNFLSAFRAYTTAKYGTPNKRLENLFCHVPECRSLGFLHYKMTMTSSLQAEDVKF